MRATPRGKKGACNLLFRSNLLVVGHACSSPLGTFQSSYSIHRTAESVNQAVEKVVIGPLGGLKTG
jgi:hypothetical protein